MPQPTPRIAHYQQWLLEQHGLRFDDYDALWRWSTTELRGFWSSIREYFDIESPTPCETVLAEPVMPGARWFPGLQLNYARQALRHADAAHAAGQPAVLFQNERMDAPVEISWPELRRQVAAFAQALQALGVQPGDRVCAWLPNTPQAVVAFLACASVGAVWSVCSPDMGPLAVLDRFRQIRPKVLVAVDGQVWGGQRHDRRAVLQQLLDGLPSVTDLVLVADLDPDADAAAFAGPARRTHAFAALTAGEAPFAPRWLPFDHPLWVVYSSGTSGLPKPIVHGHGGIVLEMMKGGALHNDLHPSAEFGERFHWYSSTGWIMWNCQVGGLLGGTTICLYDGSPAGRTPGTADWGTLWRFAAAAGVTWFGAGAAFYASCLKAGVEPMREGDLARLRGSGLGALRGSSLGALRGSSLGALRAVGSTGSPLSEECYQWLWDHLPEVDGQPIWIDAISGGTDFAGAFVGGLRTHPVVKGEMQCRWLGAAVESWNEAGEPLIDAVGELVCTQPMPSMPLYFWGDEAADAQGIGRRYRESYFDMYPGGPGKPAAWRHGDWIRIVPRPGACGAVIYGRSDATINRHGVRMGTAELYRAVEALPEVLDSLVVDLEYLGRESWMPLFVVLREGLELDEALRQRICRVIREALSPRHVPDEIVAMAAVPRTLSGKKMELPVKKLLLGADPAQVLNRDAMASADCVDAYIEFARRHAARGAG